ncbi:MAG TPA: cation acetate symporter [Woeseiaceae bacterium]|nr:cation acetate symporter [Woeseiaceae bacterium]
MNGSAANTTAIVVFLAFIAAGLAITWWAARRTQTAGEFYNTGGRITGFQNGLALAGDFMSAATFLGLTGLAFMGGTDALLFAIGGAVGWALILLIFADRLRNLGRYTFADVVAYRLDARPMRILAAVGTLSVAIPYLIAQMVGAGALIQTIFGLPYLTAVIAIGLPMLVYVTFGGMLATTWVQVVKAGLLLGGGSMLLILVLKRFDFDLSALFSSAAAVHPLGESVLRPGGLYRDPISVISLVLAFVCGTAGLPHVLMRFFTVTDDAAARQSIGYAVVFIGYFMGATVILGLGAVSLLAGETAYIDATGHVAGGANMIAVHLAEIVGGAPFMGFIAAVAFATILAVVSGILLSASASIAYDLYTRVIHVESISDRQAMRVSKVSTLAIGIMAIALSALFKDLNIGIISALVLAIAASVNFPLLVLALYWPKFTTRGAIAGGTTGLVVVLLLSLLSPTIWVDVLGHERAIFPYAYPTLFSVFAAFAAAILVSLTDHSARARIDRDAYPEQLIRGEFGSQIEAKI